MAQQSPLTRFVQSLSLAPGNFMQRSYTCWTLASWLDFPKFRYLCNFWRIYLIIFKTLNLPWQFLCYLFRNFSLLSMAKHWENNQAIWSNWTTLEIHKEHGIWRLTIYMQKTFYRDKVRNRWKNRDGLSSSHEIKKYLSKLFRAAAKRSSFNFSLSLIISFFLSSSLYFFLSLKFNSFSIFLFSSCLL